MDIRIGTSGWYYDHWKGVFYPQGMPKSKWLLYYQEHFNTVELNATFYRRFHDETFLNWTAKAGKNFLFVFKAPRIITHRKYLKDCKEDIRAFERQCLLTGDKYGMILLQLPPQMKPDVSRLAEALRWFKYPDKVAVEFRNKAWVTQDVIRILEQNGVSFCNVDSPGMHETGWKTGENIYFRLHGRKHWYSYNYSAEELEELAGQIILLDKRGAKRIFVLFNNDFGGYAPANAILLHKLLAAG